MYDGGKIIIGLIIFLIFATAPFWYTAASGETSKAPDPKIITGEKQCVEDAEFMRHDHMDLLNEWRDLVVRGGERAYTTASGRKVEMSLSNTCMSCHSNKSEFCDECHDYLGVDPYCWDCHIEPEGGGQ
jgi:hypothetical protein